MSRDKVEGFLIGLGTGVLVAAFMEIRQELGQAAAVEKKGAVQPADAELARLGVREDMKAHAGQR